jgi:hypothetical protein
MVDTVDGMPAAFNVTKAVPDNPRLVWRTCAHKRTRGNWCTAGERTNDNRINKFKFQIRVRVRACVRLVCLWPAVNLHRFRLRTRRLVKDGRLGRIFRPVADRATDRWKEPEICRII